MSETEEFRPVSPVKSVKEESLGRSSPIRHVDLNPGSPKSWSRQGTLDESWSKENPCSERSSPIRHVDFTPGTPKSWSRQGTLDESCSKEHSCPERSSPIRHVDFNPGTPKSWSRQGTLEKSSSKDNLSLPGSPVPEKPVEPFKSFGEPSEPSQAVLTRGKTTDSERTESSGVIGVEGESESKTGGGAGSRGPSSPGGEAQCPRNGGSTAVGEWNSLPVLVERLRAALELSLATSNRREEETPALPEDSGVDSEEDFRVRNSVERGILAGQDQELKSDLKFLEDLLLSDIQTALSRLRETLERLDVTALAKHGAAGDPSSKLHLLKLVSSLLSRLQVPEEATTLPKRVLEPAGVSVAMPVPRKRRGTRHTIGVTTEELASARKWLEEERERQNLLNSRKAEGKLEPVAPGGSGGGGGGGVAENLTAEPEERHHDKCTKDAINQRQSLRDKNKETSSDQRTAYRGVVAQNQCADVQVPLSADQCQPDIQGCQAKATDTGIVGHENDESSRVSKLAAALRQRAEMAVSSGRFSGNNKFSAKKSRIKRANTIDIPSYLKLQAETLGQESTGCISLRRPINVGDRVGFNAVNRMVPSFQPKTENDRKFLAMINKNNDTPVSINQQPPPFKPFGYTKPPDLSKVANENWNSRFSNIKTTFDKPSPTDHPEKGSSSRNRMAKGFPPISTSATPETSPGSINLGKDRPVYNNTPNLKSDSGFRHAPSSPFRKIEKTGVPSSPSKVPPAYHWSKNSASGPTSSLKEKAKMMFDRDVVEPRGAPESQPPNGFPRPPWIENDRQERKAGILTNVTENGRLDYRSFCKQFAPFVGKGVDSRHRDLEDDKIEHPTHRRDSTSQGKVVDGKISFRMLPNKSAPVLERRRQLAQFGREKLSGNAEPKAFGHLESTAGRSGHASDKDAKREQCLSEATLRGSSSVGVQTGMDEDHLDEARSFRVAAKFTKGAPSLSTNACVQTGIDLTHSRQTEECTSESYARCDSAKSAQPSEPATGQPARHFILDHNQNYRVIAEPQEPNDRPMVVPSSQQLGKVGPRQNSYPPDPIEKSRENHAPHEPKPTAEFRAKLAETWDNKRDGTGEHREIELSRDKSFLPTILSIDSRPEEQGTNLSQDSRRMDWPIENPGFLDDENIQNQDISPEAGVITRYTCAIATVESVDSPEPRSEEVGPDDSRTPSSPSPSQCWSRSRPPTNGTTTPEEEIRRHNLLQQSLVRRLQNERTSLNEPRELSPNYSPSVTPNYVQETYEPPAKFQSSDYYQPSNLLEPVTHQQSARFASPIVVRCQEASARVSSPTTTTTTTSSSSSSSSSGAVNRIVALREAYEQPLAVLQKPMQKERSPIPNGLNQIDSSDEYLVSCATKPSRSIVLSKSESWHQLAGNSSYPRAPRMNVPSGNSGPQSSYQNLPKPPKPKSPSSQKLRSKQYEASSSSDSVKKMEEKIRRYFDGPTESLEVKESRSRRSSPRHHGKGLVGLTRSRTMPGISDEKHRLSIPNVQLPLLNVNTADVDKVFDDLFEEVTRTDSHRC